MSQTSDDPDPKGLPNCRHHQRNLSSRILRRMRSRTPPRYNYVDPQANQLGGIFREPRSSTVRRSVLDYVVLPLDIAEFLQSFAEGIHIGSIEGSGDCLQHADAIEPGCWLLSTDTARPCDGTTKNRYDLPSSHMNPITLAPSEAKRCPLLPTTSMLDSRSRILLPCLQNGWSSERAVPSTTLCKAP